ncbi:hypothetical protein E2C01_048851 [Portunus trituberculatus]|uniref:Uncharacterized protein n=1 Tax=Portunus trituberculatus TaxID=210409 RepID=A0A5B7G7I2_PORTR|nr:hypothetical protein [Portunus trituberculatus]
MIPSPRHSLHYPPFTKFCNSSIHSPLLPRPTLHSYGLPGGSTLTALSCAFRSVQTSDSFDACLECQRYAWQSSRTSKPFPTRPYLFGRHTKVRFHSWAVPKTRLGENTKADLY